MNKWHQFQIYESTAGRPGHVYNYQNGDEKDDIRFTDVRGAWAWPTDISPFYCVIVGQEWFDLRYYADKKPSFLVLSEVVDSGLDLERRFNELADLSALYRCNFYADLSPAHEPETDAWYDFVSNKHLDFGDLEAAPYSDNFRLGVEFCKTLVSTHKMTISKDTEVFSQLQRIMDKDLADPQVKSAYYAVEALRHVVCGFKRDPASPADSGYDEQAYPGGAQNWLV